MVLRSNGGFPDALGEARVVRPDPFAATSTDAPATRYSTNAAPVSRRLSSVLKIQLKPMIGTVSTIRSVASSRRRFNRRARPARRD